MKDKNDDYNYLNNFVSVNKFNEKWNGLFYFFITYFKNYNYSNSLINFIKLIHSNKNIFLILFVVASWFWSNLLLKIVCNFVLVDSLIISLLVLQNNSINHNSRRLCKNIILYTLSSLNIIGGMFTLIMIIFIYLEYSKFINRLLFKTIKFIIKLIGGIFPPIFLLYPDIKLFNFDDPDNTIESTKIKKRNNKDNITKIKYNKHINSQKNKKLYKLNTSDSIDLSNSSDSSDSSDSSNSSDSSDSSDSPIISKINSDIVYEKIKKISPSNIKNIKKKKFIKKVNKKTDKSKSYDEKDLILLKKFDL